MLGCSSVHRAATWNGSGCRRSAVNQDLEHLVVLQAQDLELARLRGELAEAPRRVKAAETALAGAETALSSCRQRLAAEEKLRRGHESVIGTHRSKLDRLRRS